MAEWSQRYAYTEENVRRYTPTSGGVYRLINKKGEDFYVFYVGQSNNLERRLLEHLSPNESDECIKRHLRQYSCYFRYVEVASQSERDRIEQEQIQEYNPTCNG